ncbi:unnamed protein product, partial [Arabidopsis lyrata]
FSSPKNQALKAAGNQVSVTLCEPVKKKDEGRCSVHREETQETCNRRPTQCLVLDMARLF